MQITWPHLWNTTSWGVGGQTQLRVHAPMKQKGEEGEEAAVFTVFGDLNGIARCV